MESKTKNTKTRPQIAAMAARAFGGTTLADSEDAVLELKDGWFNAAYSVRLADGRDVILKIAPPRDAEVLLYEKNIMATEVASMRLVRQNPAIPVPEIHFFDDAQDLCDSSYFFMEKVAGVNLEHARASLSPEAQTSIDLQLGEIIREINGFTGAYFGYEGNPDLRANSWREAFIKIVESVLEDGARKNVVYDYGHDEIRAAVLRNAPALEEVATPCLVHWDVWDPNIFVKEGRVVGIIDFERALWADPLMEAQFRPLSRDGITDSMRGYGKTSFTFDEERRCRLYSLHLALIMNTECYYRNYDTDLVYNLSRQMMSESMDWLRAS
ncbi:aminoglycoside phosphotransferase family protein [Sorangium sp. So ce134]